MSAPLVLAALGAVTYVAQWHFTSQTPRLRDLAFAQTGWLVCAALAPAVVAASKRWPLSGANVGRRLALHLCCFLLYWAAAAVLYQGVLAALFDSGFTAPGVAPAQTSGITRAFRWFAGSLPFGAIVYFSIVGVEHAIRYFGETRERDLRMAQLEERLTRARLAALQSQMNPHFLFNALNTIAVRAREGDGVGTARIVEQLSEILRRALSRDQAYEVTLAEELEVVQHYLAIEQARFADRLRVTLDVDDAALGAAVPTFAVQHLAENAVRHGIARRAEAGRVAIAARRDGDALEVRVADDGPGGARDEPGGGIANTRERLRSLYGSAASLTVGGDGSHGTVATLRVPYRELALEPAGTGGA
ncbi:MAG TPA: histidine kinase [Gemmatimonadaceae bacterium]|nr:histidine kinase [Gemmatimonadaceae bacterium]